MMLTKYRFFIYKVCYIKILSFLQLYTSILNISLSWFVITSVCYTYNLHNNHQSTYCYYLFIILKVFQEHPLCEDYSNCMAEVMTTPGASLHFYSNISNIIPTGNSNITDYIHSNTSSTTTDATANLSTTTYVYEDVHRPNTALLTTMLTLFTFVIAYALKGLRNKKVLGRTVSLQSIVQFICGED